LTFVRAGSELASVGSDGSVALSAVPSLDPTLTLKAPTNDLRSVWVQGDLLSTIDIQGTIFTWDIASGQPVDTLPSGLRTWDAALLDDGRLIAGLVDHGAAVWLLRPDAVRSRACDLAGRDLTADEWQQYAPGLDGPPPCRGDRSFARGSPGG
jgi:WD40 repeat protein